MGVFHHVLEDLEVIQRRDRVLADVAGVADVAVAALGLQAADRCLDDLDLVAVPGDGVPV